MVVTIIGSLKDEEKIKRAVEYCGSLFGRMTTLIIHDPITNNKEKRPLLKIMSDYLEYIEEADLVIVASKHPGVYGESTTYELAYALRLGKPILEFVSGEIDFKTVE